MKIGDDYFDYWKDDDSPDYVEDLVERPLDVTRPLDVGGSPKIPVGSNFAVPTDIQFRDAMTGDFSVAFMHTPLKEEDEIYVEIPVEYGYGHGYVWRLQQALYRMREAAVRLQLSLREHLDWHCLFRVRTGACAALSR